MHRLKQTAACALLAIVAVIPAIPPAFAQLRTAPPEALVLRSDLLAIARPYTADLVSQLEERRHSTFDLGWQIQNRSLFTYQGGFRVEENVYLWNGSAWAPEHRKLYTGDGFARVRQTETWDDGAVGFIPLTKTDYNYAVDLSGRQVLLEERTYTWNAGDWTPDERTLYDLDGMTVLSAQTDAWGEGVWVPLERYDLTVEDGRPVQTTQEWDGGAWVNLQRIVFTSLTSLDELYARLLEVERETADFEDLMYGLHRIPDTALQVWDGDGWINDSRQETWYDISGTPTTIAYDMWDEGAWVPTARLELVHDQSLRLVDLFFVLNFGDDEWHSQVRETYTRDNQNAVTSVLQSVDAGDGLSLANKVDFFWSHTATGVERDDIAADFALDAAYPNPFNPSTRLQYRVRESGPVAVRVFDALGRQVAVLEDGVVAAGPHDVTFDADRLPSGHYLVRLETASGRTVRVVTLLK